MLFSAVAEVDDRLIAEWDRSQNRTAAPLLEHGIGPSLYCSIKKPLVVQCLVARPPGPPYSASGPIPLGTQKISTYVLPRYTSESHARANERTIHAGKG